MLDERIQNIIKPDENEGHRLSLFECSRDEAGTLLVGFTSQRTGKENIHIDNVRIADAETGNDIGDISDRYWSSWSLGPSDYVTLLCLRPKETPPTSIRNLNIDVSAAIFGTIEFRGRIRGGRRLREADYTFEDVPVSEGAWPTDAEFEFPPWSKR